MSAWNFDAIGGDIDNATQSSAGLMSPTDKTKLDNLSNYSLPPATTSSLGGVIPDGTSVTVDANGTIHAPYTYTLSPATTSTLGGVIPDGSTITVDANGTIHGTSGYTLPIATTTTLGGVMPDGISINADTNGVISSAEFGTSGNWAWIKLPNGIAACWGRHTWNITSWSTWGSVYTGTRFDPISYPTNLFIAKPIEIVTMEGPNGATLWAIFGGTDNTASTTRNYTPVRGTTGWTFTESANIDILAIGRWQ